MKTVLTFILLLSISMSAQAQEDNVTTGSKTSTTTTVTNSVEKFNPITLEGTNGVARLYKHRNSRVLKALSFSTKKNSNKLV
jgi:hypothetical protein